MGKIDKLHGDEGSRCTEVRVTLVALMLGRSELKMERLFIGCTFLPGVMPVWRVARVFDEEKEKLVDGE